MNSIENLQIEIADKEDLPEILELQKVAFVSEAELYNNHQIEPLTQTLDSILEDYESHLFLKAVCQNRIIGSVKLKIHNDICQVGKLIVSPDFQNRGIGKKLMEEAERFAPGIKTFELFTGSKSTKNIHLYEKMGYAQTEEFEDPNNPDVTLIRMVKTITCSTEIKNSPI